MTISSHPPNHLHYINSPSTALHIQHTYKKSSLAHQHFESASVGNKPLYFHTVYFDTSELSSANTDGEGTCSLIYIFPCSSSTHDIIDLFNSAHSSIVVFFVDDEFIGTGTTYETVSVGVFFSVFVGGDLTSLEG